MQFSIPKLKLVKSNPFIRGYIIDDRYRKIPYNRGWRIEANDSPGCNYIPSIYIATASSFHDFHAIYLGLRFMYWNMFLEIPFKGESYDSRIEKAKRKQDKINTKLGIAEGEIPYAHR